MENITTNNFLEEQFEFGKYLLKLRLSWWVRKCLQQAIKLKFQALQINLIYQFDNIMWNTPFVINSFPFYYPALTIFQNTLFQPEIDQIGLETAKNNQTFETLIQHKEAPLDKVSQVKAKKSNSGQGKYRKLSAKQKYKRKCERQDNFQRKKQKKDRNLPSNIFKYFFQFLMDHSPLQQFLKTSIPPEIHVCVDQLAFKLKLALPQNKVYISPSLIRSLCYGQSLSEGQRLVFRIILKKFLITEGPISIASRHSFKKSQKLSYLKACRKLWDQIKMKQ